MTGLLEIDKDPGAQWVLRLARDSPGLFGRGGGRKVAALKEPQTASHDSRIYEVDGVKVHVKFFRRTLGRTGVTYDPCREMKAEYAVLKEYERSGFTSGRYQVAQALGINEEAGCALATRYVDGLSLLSIITEAFTGKRDVADMYAGLELAAGLLKKIHTVMPQGPCVDHCEMFYSQLRAMIYLEDQRALDGYHRRLTKGHARWYGYRPLFEQPGVTVHGDANPSNFKVGRGVIYAFDMERSRPGRSACVDLGSIAAELIHHSAHLGGDPGKAKPFIDHFLRAYEPGEKARKRIERVLPFYISRSLLKIASLGYWNPSYRQFLVEQGTRQIEVLRA